MSATAAAAALAADEPSPEAGRTPLLISMWAGASSASAMVGAFDDAGVEARVYQTRIGRGARVLD